MVANERDGTEEGASESDEGEKPGNWRTSGFLLSSCAGIIFLHSTNTAVAAAYQWPAATTTTALLMSCCSSSSAPICNWLLANCWFDSNSILGSSFLLSFSLSPSPQSCLPPLLCSLPFSSICLSSTSHDNNNNNNKREWRAPKPPFTASTASSEAPKPLKPHFCASARPESASAHAWTLSAHLSTCCRC